MVMAEGRLLTTGDPEAVRRDPRVIDAYLGGAAA
jgi:branched-chain amino acid transport system ATP-binding protein